MKAFQTGYKTPNGKDELIICPSTNGDLLSVGAAQKKGFKVSPSAPLERINGHTFLKDPIPIPCGHCVGCRMDKAREYSTRAVLESAFWRNSYFITLTFDDRHLRFDKDGVAVISKRDLQLFFKRCRKDGFRFRYLACGEYGSEFSRPHYHLIAFTDQDLKLHQEAVNVFTSPFLEKEWPFGIVSVSYAEPNSIAYVAGYVMKKVKDEKYFSYPKDHLPFRLVSRRPGLGVPPKLSLGVKETGKIYGAFGKVRHAPLPLLFKRVFDEETKDAREALKETAKELWRSRFAGSGIYDFDEDRLGFVLDAVKENKLKNIRNEKEDF